MPAEEFQDYKVQAGRGEQEREEDSLKITDIPKLQITWRRLLRDSVLLTLQTYATDLKTDQDLLSNKEVYAKLSWREQQALQVRYGQKVILHQLLELTSEQLPWMTSSENLLSLCFVACKGQKFGSFAIRTVKVAKGKLGLIQG